MTTEPQAKWLIKLIAQAHTDPADRITALTALPTLTTAQASSMIDSLKAKIAGKPFVPPATAAVAYVPPLGHYWVAGSHVTLKKSKYKTQTYLYVNDNYYGTVGASTKAAAFLAEHFPDAEAAHTLVLEYAKVTSKCGICNTKLSDPKSIAAGIGPTCAKKFGK